MRSIIKDIGAISFIEKLDRLHWFIVAIAIAAVFKDNILAFFA